MNNSLYQILVELSECHCKFKPKGKKKGGYADLLRFDLDTKTISNGNTIIMKKGKLLVDKIELTDGTVYDLTNVELIMDDDVFRKDEYEPLSIIEKLYADYKYSIPSEHSQFSCANFKALKADELSMKQLINNGKRIKAQYMLEAYIVLASIKGWIPWNNDMNFFWQSPVDRDLILFKSWI